ncbi:MAG TPA: VanZ family protein [Azoarcus taiwanensis]|nr:VanZ family protein [Azoarcus taiwanensis]
MTPTVLRLAFAAALLSSFALALLPSPDLPAEVEHADKIAHFIAYFGLAALGLFVWPRHAFRVCVLLLAHGALVELAQSLTDYRQGDIWDWLADAAGVAAALVVHQLLRHWKRNPRT